MNRSKTPVLQPAGDVPVRALLGGSVSVRVGGDQTNGELALVENVIPPGYMALPLHVHPGFDEAFHVLAGALCFRVGAEVITAAADTVVYAPGAVPHTFANLTDRPARFALWITPAGHERYFDALVDLVAANAGRADPVAFAALMDEHGITAVGSADPRDEPGRDGASTTP